MNNLLVVVTAAVASVGLIVGAVIMLRSSGEQQLRGRLVQLVPTAEPDGTPSQDLLAAAARGNVRPPPKLLVWLGRSPNLPTSATTALPLVILAGAASGLLMAGVLSLVADGTLAVLAALAVAAATMNAVFRRERQRYRDALFVQLPDAIQLIVRGLRAGMPLNEALRTVARDSPSPTRVEFERALHQLAIGAPTDQALNSLAARTGLPEYNFLAISVGLQLQTGGNLAETLDTLGELTRQRVALRGRIQALTAEARMSAKVLVALPLVVALGVGLIAPDHIAVLVTESLGRQLLVMAAVMLTTGVLIMRHMLRSASAE